MRCRAITLALLLLASPINAAEPRVDAYGDPLPPGAIARLGTMRLRHNGPIISAAFSADGKQLISADGRDEIRVWDGSTGKLLQSTPYKQDVAIAFGLREELGIGTVSPDGKLIAGQLDKMILLVDAVTKEEIGRIPVSHHCSALAFSPDNTILAVIQNHEFILYDVVRGQPKRERPDEPIQFSGADGLVFEPNGRTAATVTGHYGDVRLRDVATGEVLWHVELENSSSAWHSLSFAPDGKTLAVSHKSSQYADGGYSLIETATGRVIHHWDAPGSDGLQFSPDGRTLLAIEGYKLRLWDIATGREVVPVQSPLHSLESPVFSPDSLTIATLESDGPIRLWETRTGRQQRILAHDDWSTSGFEQLAFSPDGKRLLATAKERPKDPAAQAVWDRPYSAVTVWDAGTGRLLRACRGEKGFQWSMAVSPDGKTVAAQQDSGNVWIWDSTSGDLKRRLEGKRTGLLGGSGIPFIDVQAIVFTVDGKTLVWADNKGKIRFWDVKEGRKTGEVDYEAPSRFAMSPDGRRLAALTEAREAYSIVDTQTGRTLNQIKKDQAYNLIFSADARMLAILPFDEPVQLFEVGTGQERAKLDGTIGSHHAAFSADGRLLATSMRNGTVLVWDLAAVVGANRKK
jgi:WD40 repeat protein